MKRFAYYAFALIVVSLSQLCGPRLIPWRLTLADALVFLLAFAAAAALVAFGIRRKDPALALISVGLQALLIRYNFVERCSFSNTSSPNWELIITNVLLAACYALPAVLLGWGIAQLRNSQLVIRH